MKRTASLSTRLQSLTAFFLSMVFLLAISTSLEGQAKIHQVKIDSLQKMIDNSDNFTLRTELYIEQAEYNYFQNHLLEETESLENALESAKNSGNDSILCVAYLKLGLHRSDDVAFNERTPKWCANAKDLAEKLSNNLLMANAIDCDACFLSIENREKGITMFYSALDLKKKANASDFDLAVSYHRIGLAKAILSKIDTALHYLYLSKKKLENHTDDRRSKNMLCNVFRNIGFCYSESNDFVNAQIYADSAFNLCKEIKNVKLENEIRSIYSAIYLA